MAWIPFRLKMTILSTLPMGLHTVYRTSCINLDTHTHTKRQNAALGLIYEFLMVRPSCMKVKTCNWSSNGFVFLTPFTFTYIFLYSQITMATMTNITETPDVAGITQTHSGVKFW